MTADWSNLLQNFNSYIQKTDASSSASVKNVSDIAKHKDKFKEYLKEELKVNPDNFFVNLASGKIKIEDGAVVLSAEFDDSDAQTADIINQMLKQNSAITLIDNSKDGEISNDELEEFLSKISKIEDLSVEDNYIEIEDENFDDDTKSFIEEFINDENTKKQIDLNNDGTITKEEVSAFLNKIGEFTNYEVKDNEVSPQGSDEAEIMQEIINGALSDDTIKEIIDANGDGKLDEEEISDFLNSTNKLDNDEENLSLDDIFKAVENPAALSEAADTTVSDVNSPQNTIAASGAGSTSGSSGAGSSSGSSGSGSNNSTEEKNLNNMTSSELKDELTDANSDVSEKEANLKSVLDGNDEKIQELQLAADTAYSALQEELSNLNEELSAELDDCKNAITAKEQEINETDYNIQVQTTVVANAQAAYDSEVAREASLQAAKSALQSSSDSDLSDSQKSDKKSKLSQIESELASLDVEGKKQALEEAKQKLEELKEKRDDLVNNSTTGLNALNANRAEIETKISNLNENSPELAGLLSNWQNAQTALDSAKETAKEAAVKELGDARDYAIKVQDALSERESKDIKSKYALKGFSGTYTINGVEYDTLAIEGFDSLEELQKYVVNAGLTNTGQYGTKQCFNYSQEIAQIMMGVANEDVLNAVMAETDNASTFGDLDLAGKYARAREYNSRPFHQTKASTREAEYSILASELNEGRPCVVSVPYTGGNHYVVAVGLRQGASEPYEASDFLIMDSYDGSIQQLGTRRKIATGNGVFVYDEGYTFKERDTALNYWDFLGTYS